ncbi:MAG: glycosyltransferase [Candidatus Lokiarchaeota archaeon]|nr:glycosyltransferase [Candidatus Lokiarchaeota archaeon]
MMGVSDMRILVIPELDWVSALPNRVHKIFSRLTKDNEIHVIYFEHKKSMIDKSCRLHNNLYLHKPPSIFIQNKILFYILNAPSFYFYISKIIRKYRIQIAVSTNFLFSPLIAQLTKNKIPFVFDLVDYQPFHIHYIRFLPKSIRNIGKFFLQYVLDYDITHSDYNITTGLPLYLYARSKGLKNVSIIPNGVNLRLFNSHYDKTIIKKNHQLSSPIISYIGVLEYWVDFNYLFQSIKLLKQDFPSIKLLLIGPSRHYGINRIIKLAKKYNISNNILIIGTIPYKELPLYICSSDLCILPFVKNYLTHCVIPMKLFEYLACQCPVISVSLVGVKSVFKNLIYYADTPQEFKHVFKKIYYDNKELKTKLSRSKVVIQKYDWDLLAKNFLKALNNVISKF